MAKWSPEEQRFLLARINSKPVAAFEEYIKRYGDTRSYDAVQKQLKKLSEIAEEPELKATAIRAAAESVVEDVHKFEHLFDSEAPLFLSSTDIRHTKRVNKVGVQDFLDELTEITRAISPRNTNAEPILIGSTLVILLSDLHFGKHTAFFDMEEADRRLMSIIDRIIALGIPDLEEIVFLVVGDVVEGEDIYPTQSHHIECPVIKQMNQAARSIWSLIVLTQRTFDVPVRVVTAPGNHGRMSKMAAEESNWDNAVYQMLAIMAEIYGDSNITVDLNFKAFYTMQIQGKTGMIYHHGTKHTGTPAMQNKIGGWIFTKNFDFMTHGHWHHFKVDSHQGRLIMSNGSLPGEDDLSEEMGVYDPARQGWLLIRRDKPISQFGFFEWPSVPLGD